jgi:hypothetical protein
MWEESEMLDFLLVLGLIPGTNFQITFYEYLIGVAVIAVIALRRQLRRLAIAQKNNIINYFKQKYWNYRQLKLPV